MADNDENVFAEEQHKALSRRRFLTETGRIDFQGFSAEG